MYAKVWNLSSFLLIIFQNISEPVSSSPTSALDVFQPWAFPQPHAVCASFHVRADIFEMIWFSDFVGANVQSCWKLDAKWNDEDDDDEEGECTRTGLTINTPAQQWSALHASDAATLNSPKKGKYLPAWSWCARWKVWVLWRTRYCGPAARDPHTEHHLNPAWFGIWSKLRLRHKNGGKVDYKTWEAQGKKMGFITNALVCRHGLAAAGLYSLKSSHPSEFRSASESFKVTVWSPTRQKESCPKSAWM